MPVINCKVGSKYVQLYIVRFVQICLNKNTFHIYLNIQKAIEIGVFTGSSSLCIALGMPNNGKLIALDNNEEYT